MTRSEPRLAAAVPLDEVVKVCVAEASVVPQVPQRAGPRTQQRLAVVATKQFLGVSRQGMVVQLVADDELRECGVGRDRDAMTCSAELRTESYERPDFAQRAHGDEREAHLEADSAYACVAGAGTARPWARSMHRSIVHRPAAPSPRPALRKW